jgi:drug/metabolite transporter (DMT)-like permease
MVFSAVTVESSAGAQRLMASSVFPDVGFNLKELAIDWSRDLSHAQLAYLLSAVIMVLLTMNLYSNKGPFIISRILVYLFSLSTITLNIKNVFVMYGYDFPRFVSFLHIVASGSVAFSILLYRRFARGLPLRLPTSSECILCLLPIAICFSASIGTNNMALSYLGAGFVEMIGGCAPIFVFFITSVTTRYVDRVLLAPVIVVCIGTVMCAEDHGNNFSYTGLWLAIAATFLRSLRSTMQHSLLTGCHPMDPVEALAWLSIPSMLIMGGWSVAIESSAPYVALYQNIKPGFLCSLLISCFNAILLNFSNLYVIRDLGALGVNVVGQLKGILIILGSVAMLGESVGLWELAGYSIVVLGVFFYNQIDQPHSDPKEKMLLVPSKADI